MKTDFFYHTDWLTTNVVRIFKNFNFVRIVRFEQIRVAIKKNVPAIAILIFFFAGTLFSNAELSPEEEDQAVRELQTLVEKQQKIYAILLAPEAEKLSDAEYSRQLALIENEFQIFLLRYPDYVPAMILYGKFLRDCGENELARDIFLRVNELTPSIAVVNQQLGAIAAESGDFVSAISYYRRAIDLAPDEPLYKAQLLKILEIYQDHLKKD